MASTASSPNLSIRKTFITTQQTPTFKTAFPIFTINQTPNTHSSLCITTASLSDPKPKPTTTAAASAATATFTTAPITTTTTTTTTPTPHETFIPTIAPQLPRKGSDVLIEALEREGVTHVFGYPGGASMEIHQALTRSNVIRNILPRHEQGGIFAAEGYAKASGRVGVCIATSGPGATNFVSGLADALLDSVPLVAITGQVPRRMIGTDAFQETPIIEAWAVLIDIPKDVQQQPIIPNWDMPMRLPGEELRRFVELTKIPVASTLMGLGSFPLGDELSLHMLGMHGTMYANYAIDQSDLLLAFGVRFDDRVTGKVEAFASRASIVHIDIDSAEWGKNKQPHVSLCSDLKIALKGLNSTGVGQHQMWSAHFTSTKGLVSGYIWWSRCYGVWLACCYGAALARPNALVVDVDGDGSFIMNVQEWRR
ncbi:hypothetical protein GH714_043819 [Hevea brasiliensis]|uniref:Thiamine pyrophosphate enzyme N-terminal TPP-binding domain-containing protein n=1 Tax=Hevea brasiliensis TaxID=3981 RepID=A0A6A6K3S2_HEVBR|nr:hypothetical protein GH714_043819 [Hevea brasiliensis]